MIIIIVGVIGTVGATVATIRMIVILSVMKDPHGSIFFIPGTHVHVLELEMFTDMVDPVSPTGEGCRAKSTITGKLTIFNSEMALFTEYVSNQTRVNF